MAGPGLYANIHAKRKRGEKMRKKGAKGAPKASDFAAAKRTAKSKGGSAGKGLGKAVKGMGKARKRAMERKNDLMRPGISASPDNPIEVKKGGSVSQMAQRASRMESKKLQGALKDHKKLIKKKMKRGGRTK